MKLWHFTLCYGEEMRNEFEYLAEFITKITTLETFYKFGESD